MSEGPPINQEQLKVEYEKVDNDIIGLYYCFKVTGKTSDLRINSLNINYIDICEELKEGSLDVDRALQKLKSILNLMKKVATEFKIPTEEKDLEEYYKMSTDNLEASRGKGIHGLFKDIEESTEE